MTRFLWTLLCSSVLAVQDPAPPIAPAAARGEVWTVSGERIDPSLHGRSWVETMDAAVQREREHPAPPGLQYVREPQNPRAEEIEEQKEKAGRESGGSSLLGGGGSIATIGTNFVGPRVGDPGGGWIPPDTCGAVGLNHFVSVVNSNISVWSKATGARLVNIGQQAFFASPGSLGDSRVTFDPQSQRFFILCDEFNTAVYLAVSSTSDPTGAWFKTSITISSGSDAGNWPDYPTLGVDANGVYVSAYMVGGANTMSLFAINKAPLVAATQSLGAVTAFRGLNWEGAIQPCVTHGTPGAEYCVTYSTLYRVNPPLTSPTLTNMGTSDIGGFSAPPDAPNLSGGILDTLDGRLMNAMFRNGFVWTAHAVAAGGRSVIRWYQIDPNAGSPSNRVVQTGTIDDASRHYFMPGISVNANGNMVVGFTGSNSAQFAASYVTGRKSTDPAGQTGPVVVLKAGEAGYDDGGSPSRWGDYSLTSIDPTNDLDFWTIQEYARTGNQWGTWIGQILYDNCVAVAPTNFCVAAANSAGAGGAVMAFSGTNSIAQNNFVLQTFGVPPNKTCMYLYAQDQSGFAPFGNGFRCINPPFFRVSPITMSDFVGDVTYPLNLNALPPGGHITSGQSWGFMLWYRDPPAGGALYNGSDGLSTSWCP